MSIWGGSGITNINKIRRVNRAAINVFSAELPNNITCPMQYDSIYKLVCLVHFHKFSRGDGTDQFNSIVVQLIPDHTHNTRFRNSNSYSLPSVFKTVSHNQFFFNAIKMWNSLPIYLKNIQMPSHFKSSLKLYLRSEDN